MIEFADAELVFSVAVNGVTGGRKYIGPVRLLDNGWVTFTSNIGQVTYVPGGNVAFLKGTPLSDKSPIAEELVYVPEVEAPKTPNGAAKKKSRSKSAGRPSSY